MIRIPYGKSFILFDEQGAPVLSSRVGELKAQGSGDQLVRAAMAAPIDSPRLCELAKGKKNCVIIVSDHTRPVPSRDILPAMLDELRAGSPDIDVTLLVATGFHRPTSTKELEDKLGREIMDSCRIVVHDCRDAASNVEIGTLPSGAPCVVDRLAVETDLLVAEGFIEPHFFAGFSGGRKSVLPGVADQVTVLGNHCSRFIDSPFARTGVLDGNPIHEDMLAAAEMAKLAFIVNVVIDEEKKTVAAFAGNFRTAHRRGCDYMLDYFKVAPVPSEIVVTSNGGAPLDQNVYQCAKSISAAEATCNPGGVIIECAECLDGHGGQAMYEALRDCTTTRELYDQIMTVPADQTKPDQWEIQIYCRIINNFTVIFVTRPELKEQVEEMKFKFAPSLDEALKMARAMGKESITVIPNGISVIVG